MTSRLTARLARTPNAVTINAIWAVTTIALGFMGYRILSDLVHQRGGRGELGSVRSRVGRSKARIKRAALHRGEDLSSETARALLRRSARRAARSPDIKRRLVLWVNDGPGHIELEQEAFEALGIKIVNVPSAEEALRLMHYAGFDLVISDMAGGDAASLLRALRKGFYLGPFIVYSDARGAERAAAENLSATDRPSELYEMVIEALL